MKKSIIKILDEKFNVFVERQDQRYCVFFEELESPNLSMVWFDRAKKSFTSKPIGLSEYTIVDSDTAHMIDYLNKKMKLNENDLPKVRKVIMEYSHEKIRRHFM
jgi:hypothetical protein